MGFRLDKFTLPHIEKELDAILRESAFVRYQPERWIRYWGWKTDDFYITEDTPKAFSMNCQVWAAPWPRGDNGPPIDFNVVTLPRLVGSLYGKFDVPVLPIFRDRLHREIVNAVRKEGMEWFGTCDTPRKSLDAFRNNPNRNPNSPAFVQLTHYAEALPRELESVACLLEPSVPIFDPDLRAIFIPPSRR